MLNLITFLQSWVSARTEDTERGATMVEYGLLVSLIAVVVAGGATLLAGGINGLFNDVIDLL